MSRGNLSARRVLPWVLVDIDCQEVHREITEKSAADEENEDSEEVKKKVTHQVRDVFTLQRRRKFNGMTSFTKETGRMQSAFDLVTGPESRMTFGTIGMANRTARFRCSKDHPKIEDLKTGTGTQDQTWVHRSPWRDLEETFT